MTHMTRIGIDLAKRDFHVTAADDTGRWWSARSRVGPESARCEGRKRADCLDGAERRADTA